MATYEVEHALPPSSSTTQPPPPRRRPSLTTFFSALSSIDTSSTTNTHAVPTPADVSAAYRLLASAFDVMRDSPASEPGGGGDETQHNELMEMLISSLLLDAEAPPREVKGVGEQFLTDLERVAKEKLKKEGVCPICNNLFLDDPYPLVVRLPCHKSHVFDLECIAPWLRLNATCPLDRVDLLKGRQDREEERRARDKETEDEEVWDDMYA